jgi:hypothetical protein
VVNLTDPYGRFLGFIDRWCCEHDNKTLSSVKERQALLLG